MNIDDSIIQDVIRPSFQVKDHIQTEYDYIQHPGGPIYDTLEPISDTLEPTSDSDTLEHPPLRQRTSVWEGARYSGRAGTPPSKPWKKRWF